jgi:hypothetical protein
MANLISTWQEFIENDDRTSNSVLALKKAILENLFYAVGKRPEAVTDMDQFMALAYTVRDRILGKWLLTKEDYEKHAVRTVYYLSAEFLMGPYLANNLLNLGIQDVVRQVRKPSHSVRPGSLMWTCVSTNPGSRAASPQSWITASAGTSACVQIARIFRSSTSSAPLLMPEGVMMRFAR